MRGVVVHLWREWREHRAVLLGIAIAIPCLTGLAFLSFGMHARQWVHGGPIFVGGAAILAALALSTELYAGDVSRGTFALTRRIPGGPARAWAGKALALVLGIGIASLLGAASFLGALATKSESATPSQGAQAPLALALDEVLRADSWGFSLAVLAVSSWIFLVSTWVPRGAAASAGALLLLGLFGLPGWVLWHDVPPTWLMAWVRPEIVLPALLGTALAASAWCGIHALARPKGHLRAAITTLPVILATAGTAYGFAIHDYDRWLHIDPRDPNAVMHQTFLATGGRYLYASVNHFEMPGASRPIRIDLAAGTFEEMGEPGETLGSLREIPWGPMARMGVGLVEVYPLDAEKKGARRRILDATTGATLATVALDAPWAGADPSSVLGTRWTEECRRRGAVPLASGGRAWLARGRVYVEDERGVRDVPAPDTSARWPTSIGWRGSDARGRYVDVDAETLSVHTWSLGDAPTWSERWSPTRLVVGRRKTGEARWNEIDTETGAQAPSTVLGDDDRDFHVLFRDAVLVLEQRGRENGRLVRVDARTGTRTPVEVGDAGPRSVGGFSFLERTPYGVLVATWPGPSPSDGRAGVGFYRPESNRLERWTARDGWHLVGVLDEDHGLWLDGNQRFLRVRFGTSESTLVFGAQN